MKRRIKSLAASFYAAGRGIAHAVRCERNMRIHLMFMAYVLIFGAIGRVGAKSFAMFFLCFSAVISAEAFNTAIERLCDMLQPGFDRRIAVIKDISSGAVLVCAVCTACAGLVIFLSPEVFGRIIGTVFGHVWIFALLVLSLPIALAFIFRKG